MSYNFLGVNQVQFALWFAVWGMPRDVFWVYVSAGALLAIGLIKISKQELPQARGIEKIMPLGRLFYAIPLAVFGSEHFSDTAEIATMVPSWISAHTFWVYLVGAGLIAAALSITLKVQSRLAATLLGAMFCSFVLLMDIPAVVSQPNDRFTWALALRELAFASGAWALAGSPMSRKGAAGVPVLVTFARFVIGITAVFYGVEHFLHPTFATGVPLQKIMPEWIPGRLFWAYFAGAVLMASGMCLVANKKTREAATYLGVMILLLVLFEYLPILLASPQDMVSLNYVFDTLFFSGTVLLLADACGGRDASRS
jgi:uncharacterized membrane protein